MTRTPVAAIPRCWCEIVNGQRLLANGCPRHDPVAGDRAPFLASPFGSVEEERDFWKEQAHIFERKAADLMQRVKP